MRKPRIGLVLGAGGVAGHAFHAGVLSALSRETGWDPRTADIVIGTSAGSIVGALLRAGLSAADLAAHAMGARPSAEGLRMIGMLGPPGDPTMPEIPTLRQLRMASPRALMKLGFRPWKARAGTLLAAALPAGRVSTESFVAQARPLFGDRWPDEPLWICAVRLRDGRRVVFGRDAAPVADVATAVAASCAIPAWYQPVVVDRVRYVDGGAHSPTNLDLLAGAPLDLVVVSSPMTGTRAALRGAADGLPRAYFGRRLGREVAELRRHKLPVLAFQPTGADLAVIGLNAMDPRRRTAVTRQARASTVERLQSAGVVERLALLRRAGDGAERDAG